MGSIPAAGTQSWAIPAPNCCTRVASLIETETIMISSRGGPVKDNSCGDFHNNFAMLWWVSGQITRVFFQLDHGFLAWEASGNPMASS